MYTDQTVLRAGDLSVLDEDLASLRQLATRYQRAVRRLPCEETAIYLPSHAQCELAPCDRKYLCRDNPVLVNLLERYRRKRATAPHSQWTDEFVEREIELQNFRGDSGYLWQFRDGNFAHHYLCTYLYLRSTAPHGLFERLTEDGAFGVHVIDSGDGIKLSRDLLDSICELTFLDEHIGLHRFEGRTVMDIGAGYGRFAHRLFQAVPGIGRIHCLDAIAQSTFLCDYYLGYRGIPKHIARAIPWDELPEGLGGPAPLLATNMHSFSECSCADIADWVSLVEDLQCEYLFIVPNNVAFQAGWLGSKELGGREGNYFPMLDAAGYRLVASRPKYANPAVQELGVSPTHYLLFRRSAGA